MTFDTLDMTPDSPLANLLSISKQAIERGKEEGEGRKGGRGEGGKEGRREGGKEGRKEGREEGRKGGREEGRKGRG